MFMNYDISFLNYDVLNDVLWMNKIDCIVDTRLLEISI